MKKGSITLNKWKFRLIMGNYWPFVEDVLKNVFCPYCIPEAASMVNYTVVIDASDYIILNGAYTTYGKPVSRLIETGENHECLTVAKRIRKSNIPETQSTYTLRS